MIRFVFVVVIALAASGCPPGRPAPAVQSPPPAPSMTLAEALAAGRLPTGPETDLLHARCSMCHGEDYIVQQRLTAEQWKKTLGKMQKFGAPVTDDEAAHLSVWLATLYSTDLPDRPDKLVEKAGEAVPDWRVHDTDAAAARAH